MTPDDTEFWLKEQLGFTLERGEGHAVATIVCDDRHLNPHGVVHGAVIFALVDTAMGAATMSVLDESSWCATIEIHTRFLAPVFAGRLDANVEVITAGRRVVQLDAIVTEDSGRAVARASGSFAVIPKRD
jgi:acyl-CoA thioesterase